jgi:hypothetical protein
MITEPNFSPKQSELADLMGDIGEAYNCGRWVYGHEYNVWQALEGKRLGDGIADVAKEELERCRVLSKELNGWVILLDSDFNPGVKPTDEGLYFVPMDQWLEMAATYECGRLPKIVFATANKKE